MTTTASVDAKNVLTVVTDQAYADVVITAGPDVTHIPVQKNVIQVAGMTATPLTNDKGAPKTTATFQLS